MATFVKPENASPAPKKRPVSLAPVREIVANKEDAKGSAQIEALNSFVDQIGSPHEQVELIMWKFGAAHNINRDEIEERLEEFLKFDRNNNGELEENEAMQLLEFRGHTKTFRELREMVAEMDLDHNHKLSFLEYACAIYKLDYFSLNDFVDEEARQAALKAIADAKAKREEVLKRMEDMRIAEEEKKRQEEAEIEAEKQLTGVAGKKAFFARAAKNAGDTTKTNEQKIKEEAAQRKQLREAAAAEKAASTAALEQKTPEQVAAEVAKAKADNEKKHAEEEAARLKKEKEDRAARKAAINARFAQGGGTPLSPPK